MIITALMLVAVFAVKSISAVFPLAVLYATTAIVFPLPIALLVNTIGLLTALSIPYAIGRFAGSEMVDALSDKYPKVYRVTSFFTGNQFFMSFLLRQFGFLPADVVSVVCGAIRIKFWKFLFGSYTGMFGFLFASTLIGRNITDPTSKEFILSCVFLGISTIISLLICYIYNKKQKKNAKVS